MMFFDDLDKKELERLEKIGVLKKHRADDSVIEEGLHGSSFGVILSGCVEVRKRLPGGKYKALVELKPFDLIGELGFFGAECRSASVVAKEDTEILTFEHDMFSEFARKHPKIGMIVYYNMATILAARLASNNVNLMDTIIWALGHPRGSADDTGKIRSNRRLWSG